MLGAAMWGTIAASSLVIGAALGLRFHFSKRTIGLIMAFGAGTLISALTFDLTYEAYSLAGLDAVAVGLPLGALAFWAGDRFIDRRGGRHRKRSGGQQSETAGSALLLGAVLDGIPESAVIGMSLLLGEKIGLAFVAAVFVSNLPEALSAATGMRKAGHSSRFIMLAWLAVVGASGIAAALGYGLLGQAPDHVVAGAQAFAAGAILTMLADTMMPEAFEEAGSAVGLVTVLGYSLGALLSAVA
jgi:zinc transporter, ZIP family